ncbi:hypothetical protein [Geobacter sp. SVR]|uniref:hypothetical protein n=1 Tax=Geobacter sp. SVR TaxID=2495594 RepID=UPI00143EFD23|nr:hypothetical protein [Geobacter sp. SVR]BCS55618.1 hypothetical protein GSVR_39260 [Geobacter sp. SVR]GCF83621.1 hypothetical protein GSbR_02210 [Geobacter sp. SVR]
MRHTIITIALLTIATAANAGGISFNKSQLIPAGGNDKVTLYVVKESKTTNADGSIGFDALIQYSEAGSKAAFGHMKKADRPVLSHTTAHVKCNSSKMKTVWAKHVAAKKDISEGKLKENYVSYKPGSIESSLAEVACSPDFE